MSHHLIKQHYLDKLFDFVLFVFHAEFGSIIVRKHGPRLKETAHLFLKRWAVLLDFKWGGFAANLKIKVLSSYFLFHVWLSLLTQSLCWKSNSDYKSLKCCSEIQVISVTTNLTRSNNIAALWPWHRNNREVLFRKIYFFLRRKLHIHSKKLSLTASLSRWSLYSRVPLTARRVTGRSDNRPFFCPVNEAPSDSISGHFGRITSRAVIREAG